MESQNSQTRAGSKSTPDEAAQSGRGAPERIEQAAKQVKAATEERVDAAKQRAHAAKERAADRVRKLSSAVRKIGEHMRIEDQEYIATRAVDASDRLDAVASYISDAELATLLQDAEGFARRKPAVVFGGTFLLGFAAARLLKSGGEGMSASASSSAERLPARTTPSASTAPTPTTKTTPSSTAGATGTSGTSGGSSTREQTSPGTFQAGQTPRARAERGAVR